MYSFSMKITWNNFYYFQIFNKILESFLKILFKR